RGGAVRDDRRRPAHQVAWRGTRTRPRRIPAHRTRRDDRWNARVAARAAPVAARDQPARWLRSRGRSPGLRPAGRLRRWRREHRRPARPPPSRRTRLMRITHRPRQVGYRPGVGSTRLYWTCERGFGDGETSVGPAWIDRLDADGELVQSR